MPHIKHVVETKYLPTFRSEKVAGMFDIPPKDVLKKEWDINVPIEDKDWKIGLIVGASGAGKTTLSKKLFDEKYYHKSFDWNKSNFLDDFPKNLDVKTITDTLSHVGFSSPPSWLLPFHVLSNGQKFRAEMARCLLSEQDLIVFDEFTSVVDRTVAKVGSFAVSKKIRKSNKQFVAVTCHYDVEEWLQPDWVLDLSTETFKWGSLRRPELNIEICQCHSKAWVLFAGHHYLSASLNPSAACFIATIDGEPCAFTSVLNFCHPQLKNRWREHRTVVLPDYQGLGIGNRLSEWLGEKLKKEGKIFISTTSHPAMISHRNASSKWVMTRKPSHVITKENRKGTKSANHAKSSSAGRLTCSFQYVGD